MLSARLLMGERTFDSFGIVAAGVAASVHERDASSGVEPIQL